MNNYDDKKFVLTNFSESRKRFSNNRDSSLMTSSSSSSHETLGCSSNIKNAPSKGKTSSYSSINNSTIIRKKSSTTELKKVTKLMNKGGKNKEQNDINKKLFPQIINKRKNCCLR